MKAFFKPLVTWILTLEARLVLRRHRPRIVAVTGTVGKTTTKDALYCLLSGFFFVRKSEKSFNSEIGVPLSILGLSNAWGNPVGWLRNLFRGAIVALFLRRYPERLVLEVGADRVGDIRSIGSWLAPDVVVVTRLAEVPVHVEFFPSVEALIEEKAALVDSLRDGGLLVLNADDADVLAFRDRAPRSNGVTFGTGKGSAVVGSHYETVYEAEDRRFPTGVTFRVDVQGNSVPVRISDALGRQLMYCVLAAFAVAVGEGLNLVRAAEILRTFEPPPGRMRLISGKGDVLIIDDTYNSSPVALSEALTTLSELRTDGRKVAILGDMLELGKYAAEEHEKAGKTAAQSCDILVTVGLRAREIAAGARASGMAATEVHEYRESVQAGRELSSMLKAGDIVLVKGSARMRMEDVVKELMAEPERAGELLVRQEEEWTRKNRRS